MSDPIIRPLTFTDLDGALRLSTVVGWNQRLDDWRMLLRLAPAGAFAARLDSHDACIVGTAIGIDYGSFAWIAMMLVDPAYRGRGLGSRLLEAAIDAMPSSLPIRLDATPMGRPLYQRYGFEDETTLSRYARLKPRAPSEPRTPSEPRAPSASRASSIVRSLTDADMAVVVEQDRETFSGTRGAVLEWAFHSAPQYAYVVRNDEGPVDYCLGRQGRLFDQIGPVVARDDDIAHALVSAALAAAGDRSVVVDAFDPSTGSGSPRAMSRGESRSTFTAALRDDGFVVQRPLVRMCRPGRDGLQAVPKEFAILGPEFA